MCFLQNPCCFFHRVLYFTLIMVKNNNNNKNILVHAQKKTTANKKAKWASPGAHLTFCFAFVCVRTCFLSRTVCMYWDVHEACQLMDIFVNTECNVIVFSLCSFSLLLFLFFTGCSLLSVFFSTPTSSFSHTLPLFVYSLRPVPSVSFYLSFACYLSCPLHVVSVFLGPFLPLPIPFLYPLPPLAGGAGN